MVPSYCIYIRIYAILYDNTVKRKGLYFTLLLTQPETTQLKGWYPTNFLTHFWDFLWFSYKINLNCKLLPSTVSENLLNPNWLISVLLQLQPQTRSIYIYYIQPSFDILPYSHIVSQTFTHSFNHSITHTNIRSVSQSVIHSYSQPTNRPSNQPASHLYAFISFMSIFHFRFQIFCLIKFWWKMPTNRYI